MDGLKPETLSSVIADIYDCVLQPNWTAVLTRINGYMGGAYTTISMSSLSFELPRMAAHSPWDPIQLQVLNDEFGVGGVPGLREVATGDVDTPRSTLNEMPESEFQASRFYREWVAPQGLRDGCVMKFAQTSDMIGVLATIVSLTVGVAYGAVSGYAGGVLDAVMMRLLDAFLSIPRLLLLIGVLVAWPHLSVAALVVFLGLTGWFGLSRIVRGQVLALKHAEFVTAAQALGASRRRILWRHMLPNLVSPIVVAATLGVAHVIVLEAGLSYLGIGVPPPLASWGNIILDGADQVGRLWWMALFPGLFMVLTVMTLNILAEALSDAYERR